MCGRFSLTGDLQDIADEFNADIAEGLEFDNHYNIAPTQKVLAVINDGKENRIGQLKWGLIPFWAKDDKIGSKMINARAETVDQKPSFKNAFERRRCVIPASSFFEWRKPDKQPFTIHLENKEYMGFAGLWEKWEKDGQTIHSCTIITTTANDYMEQLHHRMPVILSNTEREAWLRQPSDTDSLNYLLKPYEGKLNAYKVSKLVNSPKNEKAEILNPL